MPFLPRSTPTPSPRSSFPRRAGAGVAEGVGAAGVAGVEVEVAKGAAAVAAAKGAEVVVASSRHPVCRRDVVWIGGLWENRLG